MKILNNFFDKAIFVVNINLITSKNTYKIKQF